MSDDGIFLRNSWYVAAWNHELIDGTKLARTILERPVVIYRGPDHQFGDMSEEDKAALADYMKSQFTETLRSRFMLVSNPGPNTVHVRLTLTGAEK